MKRTIATVVTAASLAIFAAAPAVHAMGEELSMLEQAIAGSFNDLNIEDADASTLTLGQLALIKNVLESDEPTSNKKRRIEAIVNR